MTAEARLTAKLSELGIELPQAPAPLGVYKPLVITGNLAYTAGHLPVTPDGETIHGRVGDGLSVEEGYEAAMYVGLCILATLRNELDSLDNVKRLIKVMGFVQCVPGFGQEPAVINGCSDLFAEVFGPDDGVAARSAIGAAALPSNVPVEIEAIFEI